MFIAGRVLIGFGEAFNVCAGEYSHWELLFRVLELILFSIALPRLVPQVLSSLTSSLIPAKGEKWRQLLMSSGIWVPLSPRGRSCERQRRDKLAPRCSLTNLVPKRYEAYQR